MATDVDRGSIEDFVLRYLRVRGADVRETEPSIYNVRGEALPDGREELELTFDPEAAAEKPSRELVTFGSPLLEQALHETLAAGRIAHLHASPRTADLTLVEERLRSRVQFDRVRYLGIEPGRVVEGRIYRIQFILSIHGDVVQQLALEVFVDGSTGRAADAYHDAAGRLRLLEKRQFLLPLDVTAAPELVLRTAVDELGVRSARRLTGLEQELTLQGRDEKRRITAYFRQIEDELRARAAHARTPDSKSRAEQSLAAALAERDLRLREAELRYRPQADAKIAAVEVLHVPRLSTRLLLQRGTKTLGIPFRYDLTLGHVDLPVCPACGKPAVLLIGRREADKLECGDCVPREAAPPVEPPSSSSAVAAGPPAEPAKPAPPPEGRRKRRAFVPPDEQYRLAMERERKRVCAIREPATLLVTVDLWVMVLYASTRQFARVHQKCSPLPDPGLRALLETLDKGYGLPPLVCQQVRGANDGMPGWGLLNALADRLLAPEQIGDPALKQLRSDLCNDVCAHPERTRSRPLRDYDTEGRLEPGIAGPDAEFRVRVLLAPRLGSEVCLNFGHKEQPGLAAQLAAALRLELELTGRHEAVWCAGRALTFPRMKEGVARCKQWLDKLSKAGDPLPADIEARLVSLLKPPEQFFTPWLRR